MINSYQELITHFRVYHKKVHKRLTHALNKQLMGLVDQVEQFSYRFSDENVPPTVQACLEVLRKAKSFNPDRLNRKDLAFYLEIGWDKKEIATLYGLSQHQLYTKVRLAIGMTAAERRDRAGKAGSEIRIPDYILKKDPEDLTDEDAFVVARIQMIQASLGGNIEASQKIVDRFQRFIQGDLKTKWEQVKILDNFFLSHLLPALQKHIRMNDPLPRILAECREMEHNGLSAKENLARIKQICQKGRIDAKSIFRDVLKEVVPEIQEVVEGAVRVDLRRKDTVPDTEVAQPGMDKAIVKAKRRGKWKKPNPEKAERIFEKAMRKSPGIMEIPADPPPEPKQEAAEESSQPGPEEAGGYNW